MTCNALVEQNEPCADAQWSDNQWSVAQAERNGQPLLIRYRSQRPAGVKPASYPCLISATWSYQANEVGLPASEETERMAQFEDAVDDALASVLEVSPSAYLMVVLTGNGERDWLWYSREEAETMRQVNQALKGHKPYPVQFAVQQDRTWRAYAQFEAGSKSLPKAVGMLGFAKRAIAKAARILCR